MLTGLGTSMEANRILLSFGLCILDFSGVLYSFIFFLLFLCCCFLKSSVRLSLVRYRCRHLCVPYISPPHVLCHLHFSLCALFLTSLSSPLSLSFSLQRRCRNGTACPPHPPHIKKKIIIEWRRTGSHPFPPSPIAVLLHGRAYVCGGSVRLLSSYMAAAEYVCGRTSSPSTWVFMVARATSACSNLDPGVPLPLWRPAPLPTRPQACVGFVFSLSLSVLKSSLGGCTLPPRSVLFW